MVPWPYVPSIPPDVLITAAVSVAFSTFLALGPYSVVFSSNLAPSLRLQRLEAKGSFSRDTCNCQREEGELDDNILAYLSDLTVQPASLSGSKELCLRLTYPPFLQIRQWLTVTEYGSPQAHTLAFSSCLFRTKSYLSSELQVVVREAAAEVNQHDYPLSNVCSPFDLRVGQLFC